MGPAAGFVMFLALCGAAFMYIELTRKPDEKTEQKK